MTTIHVDWSPHVFTVEDMTKKAMALHRANLDVEEVRFNYPQTGKLLGTVRFNEFGKPILIEPEKAVVKEQVSRTGDKAVHWPTQEMRQRGLKAGELLIHTEGDYSSYGIQRLFMVTRDLSAADIEAAARKAPIRTDYGRYITLGDVLERLVESGALKAARAIEFNSGDYTPEAGLFGGGVRSLELYITEYGD